MYLVLLKFSRNRSQAPGHLEGHKAWIQRGFDDGVFLLAGSLHGDQGGAILAHGESRTEIEARVSADPFVARDVVSAEIIEISPSRLDDRLKFLQ